MARKITRFDEVTFDNSYFDYELADSTTAFFDTVKQDLNNIFLREAGDWFWLRKESYTTDGMGRVKSTTDTTYNIYGRLEPQGQSRQNYAEHGVSYPGTYTLYYKPEYTDLQVDFIIESGDIIVDRERNEWRVSEINEKRIGPYVALGVATLNKIGEQK